MIRNIQFTKKCGFCYLKWDLYILSFLKTDHFKFSLCKWDVNWLSKLFLLSEKKGRWLLKQFIPHSSRIALWGCLSSLLRTEGSLDRSFVESLEMPNDSLWAEVLFLAVCVEKNEGQDSKRRRQWCLPLASDRVVQLSLQARFSPVEQSILLWLFSCQPAARRKIMCPVTKMPAPLLTFTLWIVCQS